MALPAFRVAQVEGGAAPTTRYYPVKADEAFARGDVVALHTDGIIQVAVDDETTALGIAAADADPGNEIPVALFTPGTVFSAVNSGTAFSAAAVGDTCSLEAATSAQSIVVATAGNALFNIVGEDTTDSSRVLVAVIESKSQAPGGSAVPGAG